TDVASGASLTARPSVIRNGIAGLRQMVEADSERRASAGKSAVAVAERKLRKRKRGGARRAPRLLGHAGHAERNLGARVVRLQVGVAQRPVVALTVERAHAKVVGVEAQGVPLPVQRTAADPSHPTAVQGVRESTAHGVAILAG